MVYETYSERKRRIEKAGQPDVYTYDQITQKLRNQVIHIWNDAFGDGSTDGTYKHYASMEKPFSWRRVGERWLTTYLSQKHAGYGYCSARQIRQST